jgi:hypothetical protein
MGVKTTTDIECKPKATVRNFQFVEKLDKVIDKAEKAEESDEVQEGNRRSSYDLVMIRSRYIDRYDWYDTIYEENGKYGTKDATGKVLLPAQYDGIGELCHKIYCGNIPRVAKMNGKAGLVKPDGSGIALTPFIYDSISYMLIEPYYKVKKDGKLGIIGKDGHVIAPCIMDEITYPTGRCVVIRCGKKYGLVDRGVNNLYIAPQYDSIEFVDMEQPCTVMRDGVEGVINETGTFMTLEESLDYEGYLVGEYKPELFFKD